MVEHIFKQQQLELFEIGYKPALLLPRSKVEKTVALLNKPLQNYHIAYSGPHCILAHTPVPELLTETELGKFLGYYPPACDLFPTLRTNRIGVLIGKPCSGIRFVAHEDMADELKEWCALTYPGYPIHFNKMRDLDLPLETPESLDKRLQANNIRAYWDTQRPFKHNMGST